MLARANALPPIGLHAPLSRGLDSSLGSPSARGSMDRAPDYGSGGWGFKSLRARQIDRHIQFPLSGVSSRARTSLARSIRVMLAASIRRSLIVSEQGSVRCRGRGGGRVACGSRSASGRYQIVRRQDTFEPRQRAPSAVGASLAHAHNLSGARTTSVIRTLTAGQGADVVEGPT